ncbi:hypothetical protein FGSG_08698 [Fusarium graminearum PH-1]|uniref:hypothetical protein n=1 Tax=Gibberella zeae (strain ATCC MYA-4620 / CBS 123657 / FGSC 9075 / NRRL 31084 / PH-1) TaxID=229533 RepID=UPI000023EE0B|nr:hypothetical protein FGSG_08698 [Fusarium graminearum PH-1]ESU14611.1 hypothetical protein FGSG_08698 [Fusarium graminearum PH-1]|eukprot:XP_011320036.1 hypothetical protein FGSG_08698 [Fusarium graminearum PH-1]
MGPVVGSNTDKVSDKAGGPTYLLCKHNISPNHNHFSRRGCPPLYVLAAGRLDGNTGEETYQHLIWACSKVILCSAGEKRGNEAAVQKTGRSTCTYCICWGKSYSAAQQQSRYRAPFVAIIGISQPSLPLDLAGCLALLIFVYCALAHGISIPVPTFHYVAWARSGTRGPDCGLAAAFVGFVGCSGEVVFDPSTPAVAVAETDQLDSVSFATPEGVEHNGDGVRKASLMVPRWSADYACHKWWWWSR